MAEGADHALPQQHALLMGITRVVGAKSGGGSDAADSGSAESACTGHDSANFQSPKRTKLCPPSEPIPRLPKCEPAKDFILRLSSPAGAPCILSLECGSWPIMSDVAGGLSSEELFHCAVRRVCQDVGQVACHEATQLTYKWKPKRQRPTTRSAPIEPTRMADLCARMNWLRAQEPTLMEGAARAQSEVDDTQHDLSDEKKARLLEAVPKQHQAAEAGGAQEETHIYIQARDLPIPQSENPNTPVDTSVNGLKADAISSLDCISSLVRTPAMLNGLRMRQFNMWLGSCRTSRIHFDGADNLHVVVGGRKRVRLWAAGEVRRMYPIIQRSRDQGQATMIQKQKTTLPAALQDETEEEDGEEEEDDDDTEHEKPLARSGVDSSWWCPAARYPLFHHVPRMEATLEAGEAIFIPRGWWHEFSTFPEPAISFNWWFALPDRLGHLQLAAKHRPTMLALNSERYQQMCCAAVDANP